MNKLNKLPALFIKRNKKDASTETDPENLETFIEAVRGVEAEETEAVQLPEPVESSTINIKNQAEKDQEIISEVMASTEIKEAVILEEQASQANTGLFRKLTKRLTSHFNPKKSSESKNTATSSKIGAEFDEVVANVEATSIDIAKNQDISDVIQLNEAKNTVKPDTTDDVNVISQPVIEKTHWLKIVTRKITTKSMKQKSTVQFETAFGSPSSTISVPVSIDTESPIITEVKHVESDSTIETFVPQVEQHAVIVQSTHSAAPASGAVSTVTDVIPESTEAEKISEAIVQEAVETAISEIKAALPKEIDEHVAEKLGPIKDLQVVADDETTSREKKCVTDKKLNPFKKLIKRIVAKKAKF